MNAHVTVEVTAAQQRRLEEIAAHEQISVSELVLRGLESVIRVDVALLSAVEKGEQAFQDGDYLEFADAEAELRAKLQGRRPA